MPKVSDAYLLARREQILNAAETCFGRKGLRDTTMQDIADEAGVSYGVVYRYFPSKDDLFRAASAAAQASREARFSEAAQQGESVSVLAEVVRLGLARWADPASTEELRMRLQIFSEAVRDPGLSAIVLDGLNAYWTRFIDVVRRGQEAGEIDPTLDPRPVAQLLFALLEGFTDQKTLAPDLDIAAYQRLVALVLERSLRPAGNKEGVRWRNL